MDPAVVEPNLLPYDTSPAAIAAWASVGGATLIAAFARAAVSSGLALRHVPLLCLLLGVGGALIAAFTTDLSVLMGLILGTMAGSSAYGGFVYNAPEINVNGSE